MPAYKDNDFNTRRDAAANAKKAILEKFKSAPKPEDASPEAREARPASP